MHSVAAPLSWRASPCKHLDQHPSVTRQFHEWNTFHPTTDRILPVKLCGNLRDNYHQIVQRCREVLGPQDSRLLGCTLFYREYWVLTKQFYACDSWMENMKKQGYIPAYLFDFHVLVQEWYELGHKRVEVFSRCFCCPWDGLEGSKFGLQTAVL